MNKKGKAIVDIDPTEEVTREDELNKELQLLK
jgi:hypothetical protein